MSATTQRDFTWGVSTSSYQIEGAVNEDGRGPSIWDLHCRQRGRIRNDDTGDVACDHYHRYAEDVAIMREMGVQAYRFSVAWPRVLPRGRGAINPAGLDFYDRLIDALLAAKIEPWLCLFHWDLPVGLDELGGWTNRDSAGWFADYATLIARRYGDRVKRFATFNEPSVFAIFGYLFGWNAPGIADRDAFLRTCHHINLAHGAGVDVLRALVPGASLGAVHNRQPTFPRRPTEGDREAAARLDALWNLIFPDPQHLGHYPAILARDMEPFMRAGDLAKICRPVDWFGMNHYSPIYAREDAKSQLGFAWADAPDDEPKTGIGWNIRPEAFCNELIAAHTSYGLPVYVLENGFGARDTIAADGAVHDQDRIDYLTAYIGAMDDANRAGADVRGYFVWSLLDNFEWGSGYSDRFGLVYVDYPTQRRIPKDSSRWYADLIKARHLTPALSA